MYLMWKAAPFMLAAATMVPVGWAQSQPTHPVSTPKVAAASQQTGTRRMNWREERMAERKQTMVNMKAMDARLQAKVDVMNRATGPAKEAAMATVLNEMAQERHEMMSKMEVMGANMMALHGGMMNSAKGPSSTCPCMQGKQGTKAPMSGMQSKSGKPNS